MTQATAPLPPLRQTSPAPPPTIWSDAGSPLPVKTKRSWKTWHLVAVAVVALLVGAAAGWLWWWWLTAGILPR